MSWPPSFLCLASLDFSLPAPPPLHSRETDEITHSHHGTFQGVGIGLGTLPFIVKHKEGIEREKPNKRSAAVVDLSAHWLVFVVLALRATFVCGLARPRMQVCMMPFVPPIDRSTHTTNPTQLDHESIEYRPRPPSSSSSPAVGNESGLSSRRRDSRESDRRATEHHTHTQPSSRSTASSTVVLLRPRLAQALDRSIDPTRLGRVPPSPTPS